jgi:hypothetical protein
MSKGQYLTPHQQGIVKNYYQQRDTIFVGKLGAIVSDLALTKDPKEVGRLWAKAKEFLAKTSANPTRVAKLLSEKNLEELARIVGELSGAKQVATTAPSSSAPSSSTPSVAAPASPDPPSATASPQTSPTSDIPHPTSTIPHEVLKHALHAFKKRLKLTRLNDESRLSPRVMTGGRKSEVVGIIPPDQYGKEIWDALVKEGKLRYTGSGFYELLPGA